MRKRHAFASAEILNPKRYADAGGAQEARIFPYYAGYSAVFASTLLGSLALPAKSVVFDPWNGSGVTTLTARRFGYSTVGQDLNPVMVLAAKAELLSPQDATRLIPLARHFLDNVRGRLHETDDDPLCQWLVPHTASFMRALEERINSTLVSKSRKYAALSSESVCGRVSPMAAFFYVVLNSQTGTIRDFVFKEVGDDGPFLGKTNLSDKRYSRQFTLAQICINSFHRAADGEFVRARLQDLEDFFAEKSSISKSDENLVRIRRVLKAMDTAFAQSAQSISSRAVAVSAYLLCEELVTEKSAGLVTKFAKYYNELLNTIESDMDLISQYKGPKHPVIMDQFQKYVLQASVEPYSIRRRNDFLRRNFARYVKGGGL